MTIDFDKLTMVFCSGVLIVLPALYSGWVGALLGSLLVGACWLPRLAGPILALTALGCISHIVFVLFG